jgi:hypothetical protein
MQTPPTPPANPLVHAGRTPRSVRAFLLGCGQALAWLLLMIVDQLVEGWVSAKHIVLVGSLLFLLVLALTLSGHRQYIKARPLALLLLGWVATGVMLFLLLLWLRLAGGLGLVIPAAG